MKGEGVSVKIYHPRTVKRAFSAQSLGLRFTISLGEGLKAGW